MNTTNEIILKCKEVLAKQYGKRLKGVILYGSTARGESKTASDIDLLVLPDSPLDYFAELRNLIDVLYPIQLESEQLISAKPVLFNDFEMGWSRYIEALKEKGLLFNATRQRILRNCHLHVLQRPHAASLPRGVCGT